LDRIRRAGLNQRKSEDTDEYLDGAIRNPLNGVAQDAGKTKA
jgi:hypothetical protein